MGLAEKILQGDIRAAARLMRDVDDGFSSALTELKILYPYTGKAYIIGITGPPGAGKSTLTDQITAVLRRQGSGSVSWRSIPPARLPVGRFSVTESG